MQNGSGILKRMKEMFLTTVKALVPVLKAAITHPYKTVERAKG